MTDDSINQLRREALDHLKGMKKPDANSSASEWKSYAEFWTKLKIDDGEDKAELANEKLLAHVRGLIEAMGEQMKVDEIIDLKEEIKVLQYELEEARNT